MKIKFLTLFMAFLGGISATFAQPETVVNEDSVASALLWEISGNGLKTPSYLFGTIHMIPKKDFFLTNLMKEKFNETEQLVLEIDMDDPSMLFSMMGGMTMKGGITLEELLTEEEYKQVEKYINEKVGMPMFMLKRMKPMFVSTLVTEGEAQTGSLESYEMKFMEMARANDMEVGGLESIEYQLSVFDSIPYEEQAKMLVDAINGKGDMSNDSFEKMVELYKKQDLNGLYQVIGKDSKEFGEYEDILLINRNKNWIPVIDEMARDKQTFFAVGAGHLPGKFGVIKLLEEAGFTLTPLK